MKHNTRAYLTSKIVVGITMAFAVLMFAAAAWHYWGKGSAEGGAITAATASSRPADPATVRASAQAAAKQLESALSSRTAGDVAVTSDAATGSLSAIRAEVGGDLLPQVRGDRPPNVKVNAFLAEHGGLLGIDDPSRQLKLLGVERDQYGHRHVSYQQVHGGVRVLGAVLKGHVSPDGRLTAVNGKFIPGIDVPTTASVAREEAGRSAVAIVAEQQPAALKDVPLSTKRVSLVVYRTNLTRGIPGVNHLAYEVEVVGGNHVREFVYVDAQTGKTVDQVSGIQGLKHRRVHEANIATPAAWEEGQLRPAVQPAHEDEVAGAGHTYNLFFNLSGGTYRSWDGDDALMITVNNDPTIVCPNANWNGTSTNYCSGTSADDVVAHEWTHAYTQETSGLIYSYQSGALNESYSDIFGETVDIINSRETIAGTTPATGNNGPRSQDDEVCSDFTSEVPTGADESVRWLMGEDAFAFLPLPPIGDAAIRDMWRPRCAGGNFFLGNPGHGSSNLYHCDASDAGGVHVNSSINNRAFALLVDGDTVELKDDGTPFASPVTVTGIGLTKAAHIFWRANSVYNGPASNFVDNADALLQACDDLLGVNLTKLVTGAEDGTGFMGANDDTVDPAPEPSGEVITASDCQQVANAIAAVEMRHDVAQQCGFTAPLDPAPAPMCGGATVERQFLVDWESGIPTGWTIGQTPLTKSQLDTRPWFLRNDLPQGKLGQAMFQENRVDLGNCADDDESGVLYMISPDITVAEDGPGFLVFEHYFLTESGYDGGNLMISINGGTFEPVPQLAYSVVPGTAFVHNPYNSTLNGLIDQNTNPKRDEEAFTGANPISGDNNWGESQVDLAAAGVAPGDTIRLRWDFGQDGCNGNQGWYVDRIEVFTCGDDAPPPPPTQECTDYPANMPVPSPILSGVGSTTTATVSGANPVADVNIRNLKGSHSYMGDLTFTLTSPAGTGITLFDGAACAGEDGIDAEFDDAAANVIRCSDWLSGGNFKPFEALAAFNGEDPNGDWTLQIADGFPLDEGTLDSWTLQLCRDLPPPPPPGEGDKTTGGGFLSDTGGGKINFGFNAAETDDGFGGELQLNDKGAGVKIDLRTVTSLGPVEGDCGPIGDSERALEFRGTGSYNNNGSASFRVCVEDNGNPGGSQGSATPDRFHLECTAGCSYNLATRAADAGLDRGNLQVRRESAPPPAESPQQGASTLILNPVLMTEGLIGAVQLLEVEVFDGDQQLLAGAPVTLTRVLSGGATQTLNAVAGPAGKAVFNVTLETKAAEYTAESGGIGSNAIHVTPVRALP